MTFKEAAIKYWKANPWFQVAFYFSLLFTGLTLWAGGAPLAFWAIIVAVYITMGVGSYFNIKKIQERGDRNNPGD